jgi:beta-N-acetylhexosaminidase
VVRFPRDLVVYPGNMALGAASVREPALGEHLAADQGFQSACELRALGIDVNLAPVLDLAVREDNPGVGVRSFSAHADLTGRLGRALVRGTLRGGVIPCLKHFPGLGEATVDPHLGLPVVPDGGSAEQLRPFRAALDAGAPLVMSSHAVCCRLDADHPATFSTAVVTDLLRNEWEFGGAVMTDDLEMGAIAGRYPWEEVIQRASGAGHDILVICHDPDRQRQAFEVLRRGLREGASWFGDPDHIQARLVALEPADPEPGGDPVQGQRVAAAIAGRAVTVIRDDRELLPLQPGCSILLALTLVRAETGVEDPLRGEDAAQLAGLLGLEVTVHRLEHAPSASEIEALLRQAATFDRLLLATTGARFEEAQAELVRACVASHPATILLPLRCPFDGQVLPEGAVATVVTAYGFRPPHLEALANVLTGRTKAYGRLPV